MNRLEEAIYSRAIITHWYDKTKHGFAYDKKLRLYFSKNTIEVSGLIEELGRHEVGQCVEYSILYPSDGTKDPVVKIVRLIPHLKGYVDGCGAVKENRFNDAISHFEEVIKSGESDHPEYEKTIEKLYEAIKKLSSRLEKEGEVGHVEALEVIQLHRNMFLGNAKMLRTLDEREYSHLMGANMYERAAKKLRMILNDEGLDLNRRKHLSDVLKSVEERLLTGDVRWNAEHTERLSELVGACFGRHALGRDTLGDIEKFIKSVPGGDSAAAKSALSILDSVKRYAPLAEFEECWESFRQINAQVNQFKEEYSKGLGRRLEMLLGRLRDAVQVDVEQRIQRRITVGVVVDSDFALRYKGNRAVLGLKVSSDGRIPVRVDKIELVGRDGYVFVEDGTMKNGQLSMRVEFVPTGEEISKRHAGLWVSMVIAKDVESLEGMRDVIDLDDPSWGIKESIVRDLHIDLSAPAEAIDIDAANPYAPYVDHEAVGELFVGRHELIRRIVEFFSMKDGCRGYVLYGQTRSGKSSVLKKLESALNASSLSFIWTQIVTPSQMGARLSLICRMIRALLRNVGIDTSSDMAIEQLLEMFEGVAAKIKKEGRRWVIAFDEFTNVYSYLDKSSPEEIRQVKAFLFFLKTGIQNGDFNVVLCGQPLMVEFAKTFPMEFGVYTGLDRPLDWLEESAMYELASVSGFQTSSHMSRCDKEAAVLMHRILGGHPRFMQAFMSRVFDYMKVNGFSRITERVVSSVAEECVRGDKKFSARIFDPFFLFDRTDFSKHDLFCLYSRVAESSENDISRSDIMCCQNGNLMFPVLLQYNILREKAKGLYEFRMRLFADYLLNNESGFDFSDGGLS